MTAIFKFLLIYFKTSIDKILALQAFSVMSKFDNSILNSADNKELY